MTFERSTNSSDSAPNPGAAPGGAVFDPDYGRLIGRSDLRHTGRIGAGTEGMPVANGRFGGPVWQRDSDNLVMQLNHTDTFMFNDASAASKDHQNSGGGGLGRVHIGFGTSGVFSAATTHHLSLYEARLAIAGEGVFVEVIPDMDADVIAIRVTDDRALPEAITVELAMLREAEQTWGAHRAMSAFETVGEQTIVLAQRIEEECDTGIQVNDHFVDTAIALTVTGRDISTVSDGMIAGRHTRRLTLPAQNGSFTVIIGGHSTMERSESATRIAVANVDAASGFEDIAAASASWWEASGQVLRVPADAVRVRAAANLLPVPGGNLQSGVVSIEVQRRYLDRRRRPARLGKLLLELESGLAVSAAHGGEPRGPDGSALRAAGENYDQYAIAAAQMWGSEGIFIGETAGILGWETLPEDVAEGMKRYYTFETERRGEAFEELTRRRNRYLPAWNWNVFGTGENQASFVTHTLVATQETAEHYWAKYAYTRDLDFLRQSAYPFIRGAAELYRSWPGLKKEEDGKYHIHHTNLHEHIWAGTDVIDDLALARGTFAVAIEASTLLGVDAERRARWQEILDDLAPYPLRSDPGALWAASGNPSLGALLHSDAPAWAQGRQPAYQVRGMEGTESPIFKMVEKYDLLNLETRDQGLDGGQWDVALNTYLHSPGYLNQVTNSEVDRNGSSRFHVAAARLGRADDMVRILGTQFGVFSTYGEFPNLLFDQLDYYSAEGYGTFAAALQEALSQSLAPTPVGDPVIRVFPAWPEAWDARYKLLAKDGFLVSSSIISGDIQYVEIESQLGATARIRNPWDSDVVLYRDGIERERLVSSKNDLLTFGTREGERIVLVRPGTTPEMYRTYLRGRRTSRCR